MESRCKLHVVFIALGVVLVSCILTAYIVSGPGTVSLLHIGALTAQIQAREARKYGGEQFPNAVFQTGPAVVQGGIGNSHFYHRSARQAAVKDMENRYARDYRLENAADSAAQGILNSYGSILSVPSEANTARQSLPLEPSKNVRDRTPSSSTVPLRVAESTSKEVSPKMSRSKHTVPSYVRRAEAELESADYVRQHSVHESLVTNAEPVGASIPTTDSAMPSTTRQPRRHKLTQKDWVQLAAKAPILRPSPGVSVQAIVKNAVNAALQSAQGQMLSSRQDQSNGPDQPNGWTRYLSRARSERLALSSQPTPTSPPSLRRQQLSVLSNRARRAGSHLYTVRSSVDAGTKPVYAVRQSSAPTTSLDEEQPTSIHHQHTQQYRAMMRQGLLPHAARHDQPEKTAVSRGGAASPFVDEEEHLHQEIDSIFGPPAPFAPHSALRQQSASAATRTGSESEHAGSDGRHAQQLSARNLKKQASESEEVTAEKVATVQRLTSQINDLVRQEQVKHLEEVRQLHRLQAQVSQMKSALAAAARAHTPPHRFAPHILADGDDSPAAAAAAENPAAEAESNPADGGDDNDATPPHNATGDSDLAPARPGPAEPAVVRVCDPLGCHEVSIAAAAAAAPPPPPAFAPPRGANGTSGKDWLAQAVDSADIWQTLLPWGSWDKSLEPEVHLDENGTIRADHDDPHGRLGPHDPWQEEAVYPDGSRHASGMGYGIRNSVGVGLFDDNIVAAAPGFNEGEGRHVRTQQAADWERNWGGQIKKGDKVLVT